MFVCFHYLCQNYQNNICSFTLTSDGRSSSVFLNPSISFDCCSLSLHTLSQDHIPLQKLTNQTSFGTAALFDFCNHSVFMHTIMYLTLSCLLFLFFLFIQREQRRLEREAGLAQGSESKSRVVQGQSSQLATLLSKSCMLIKLLE